MATLTGNKVKDTYQSLLKLNSGTLSTTRKAVEDGLGNASALKVGTSNVEVTELLITNTPTLSSSVTKALVYDDSDNTVKVRTLDASAFSGAAGVFDESFVGYIDSTTLLEAGGSATLSYASPDNTDQTSSYHFGNSPAQLQLDTVNGEYIENISGGQIAVMVDMSAFVQSPSNANREISFTMAKWTFSEVPTGSWISVGQGGFAYTTTSTVPEGVNFWGMYVLEAGERLKVLISSTPGGVGVNAGSMIRYVVREVGNII